LVLISNKLYDWTVAQVGEGASGYVLSEWGVLWQCDNFFWAIKLFLPHCQHTPPLSSHTAKGVGESQFQRLEKRFALCLLCVPNCTPPSISRKCSTVPGKKLNYIMASVAVGIRCMGPLGGKQGFLPHNNHPFWVQFLGVKPYLYPLVILSMYSNLSHAIYLKMHCRLYPTQ